MRLKHLSAQILCLLLAGLELASAAQNKVLLTGVKSLTLRQGQVTAGRRLKPIPQLKCIGGDAKGLYEVDIMRCKNMGSDYGDDDVSWACSADLPPYFKLGSTDVLCEGYSSSSDKYILRGSCGVEYRLMLTDKGYEKYGNSPFRKLGAGGIDWFAVFFWIIFAGIVIAMIRSAWNDRGTAGRAGRQLGGGGGGPWFGGGGDGGFGGGPPPPYSKFPPQQGQEGWRPGFWSGLAAGAAGSYLMGGRNREREREPRAFFMNEPVASPIFGGRRSSPPTRSFDYDDHGEGSSRHTSTGFGQTRRR